MISNGYIGLYSEIAKNTKMYSILFCESIQYLNKHKNGQFHFIHNLDSIFHPNSYDKTVIQHLETKLQRHSFNFHNTIPFLFFSMTIITSIFFNRYPQLTSHYNFPLIYYLSHDNVEKKNNFIYGLV